MTGALDAPQLLLWIRSTAQVRRQTVLEMAAANEKASSHTHVESQRRGKAPSDSLPDAPVYQLRKEVPGQRLRKTTELLESSSS
jgi:hypothetical protein